MLDFNTSHVTVYHRHPTCFHRCFLFQYISCYCLSRCIYRNFFKHFAFQYISCYCLSYPHIALLNVHSFISIHLMLLFIIACCVPLNPLSRFQYISCYCLSPCCFCSRWNILISIHLMLLFIPKHHMFYHMNHHFNTSHVTVYLIIIQC